MKTREVIRRIARGTLLPARTPRRIAVLLLAAAAVTTAGGVAASALTTTTPPPRSTQPVHEREVVSIGLGRSVPIRVVIPSLGVDAKVVPLRLDRGRLGLPADAGLAGWYEGGTSPGELGSAVIVGRSGPSERARAIFAGLDRLTAGDAVQVVRADGAIASFAVQRVETATGGCDPDQASCGEACAPHDGRCGDRDARHDTGEEAQLRLVSAYGTHPSVDHQVVVFATLRP